MQFFSSILSYYSFLNRSIVPYSFNKETFTSLAVTSSISHPRPYIAPASVEVVQGSTLCSNKSNHDESSPSQVQQPQLSSSETSQTQIEAAGGQLEAAQGQFGADEADDAGVQIAVLHQLQQADQEVVLVKGGSLNLNEQYESEAYPPNITPPYYETTREFDVDAILFSNSSTSSAYYSADLEGAQAFCRPVVEAEWPLPPAPLELHHHGKGAAAVPAATSLRLLSAGGQLVSKGTLTEQDVVGVDGEEYLPHSPKTATSDVPQVFPISREHVPPEQLSVLVPVSVDSEDSDSAASETNTIVEVVVELVDLVDAVNVEEVVEVGSAAGGGS